VNLCCVELFRGVHYHLGVGEMRGERGKGQKATGISLPESLLNEAKKRAKLEDLSLSQYLRRLIAADLKRVVRVDESGRFCVAAESGVDYGSQRKREE
jgi:hypothetical protein